MYVGDSFQYPTGYDWWHFQFSGDGSDLKLAPSLGRTRLLSSRCRSN
jgi:hypothetical protein